MIRLLLALLGRRILAACEVHEEPLPDVQAIREEMRQTLITEQVDAVMETYDWDEDWADDVMCWRSEGVA